jgi:hypothetical protein
MLRDHANHRSPFLTTGSGDEVETEAVRPSACPVADYVDFTSMAGTTTCLSVRPPKAVVGNGYHV